MINKNNKRGNVMVGIFVILTVLIIGTTLFVFNVYKAGEKVLRYDLHFSDAVEAKSGELEEYIDSFGEKAVIKSYKEMTEKGYYVGKEIPETKETIFVFDNYNDEEEKFVNGKFVELFKKYFQKEFESIEFNDLVLGNLKDYILRGAYEAEFDGEVLKLSVKGLSIVGDSVVKDGKREWNWYLSDKLPSNENAETSIVNRRDIGKMFNLRIVGLESFENIENSIILCNAESDFEKCLDLKIKNFESSHSKSAGGLRIVTLESKKEFLIDGKYEGIALQFLL